MVSHIERTGEVNHHTLKEIAKILKLPVDQLEEVDTNEMFVLGEPAVANALSSQQELINQLKLEIKFLKDTVQNQWKLLFELTK